MSKDKGPSRSGWRRQADSVIDLVLGSLPPEATKQEKCAACERAYPFGQRAYLPYKHWRAAMRDRFGPSRERTQGPREAPALARTGEPTVDALLRALADDPGSVHRRLVLADAVEELLGEERLALSIRTVQPKVEDVAGRLWPGSTLIAACYAGDPGELRYEVVSRRNGFRMAVRDLCDMIEGRTLLIDPQVRHAADLERGLAVLAMFAKRQAAQLGRDWTAMK